MLLALSRLTSSRNLNLLEEILLDYTSVLEVRGLTKADITLTMFKVWHMRAKALTWDDPKLEQKIYGPMCAEMNRFVEDRTEEEMYARVMNDNAGHAASEYNRELFRDSESRLMDLARKLESQGHEPSDVVRAIGNVMMMTARDTRDPEVLRHFRAVSRIFQTYLDDVAKIYRKARNERKTKFRARADNVLRQMVDLRGKVKLDKNSKANSDEAESAS